MGVFLLIVLIVLLIGPLRRPLLHNARFSIPFIVGFLACFAAVFVSATMAGAPPQAVVLFGLPAAFLFACLFGAEIKKWCDGVFGPGQHQQRHTRRQQGRESGRFDQ